MAWTELLNYGFVQRALIAGSFIALLCATLGVFLVLRRLSLIGDGLSHVTFGSIALALLLNLSPLYVSIPIVMASALGILKLTERSRLYGDAAIGIVSSCGVALGVMLASLAGGFNVDLFGYLFGSILSISTGEVVTAVVLSVTVIGIISLNYHDLVALTFDEESASVSGIPTGRINTIFVLLTAVTVVLAMKLVGIMLISALLIIPAATALQLAGSFRSTLAVASVLAVGSVLAGITASFTFDLPTGATIVTVNLAVFGTALLWKKGLSRA